MSRVEEATEQEPKEGRTYPGDTRGSCLVIGTPEPENQNEPITVDLVRAILFVILETRRRIKPIATEKLTLRKNILCRIEVAGVQQMVQNDQNLSLGELLHNRPLEEANGKRALYENTGRLKEIEAVMADVVRVIGTAVGFAEESDFCVVPWAEKLSETDSGTEFGNAMNRAQRPETLVREMQLINGVTIPLQQALANLIPSHIRKSADKREIKRLLNYALAELVWMIRKVSKHVILFHPHRERNYVDLARAYAREVLEWSEEAGDDIKKYITVSHELDGVALPRVPASEEERQMIKPATLHTKSAPAYRCTKPATRVLLADSLDEIKYKLAGGGQYPEGAETRIQIEYTRRMILPLLHLMKGLQKSQSKKRQLDMRLFPDRSLRINCSTDEKNIIGHWEELLAEFYAFVVDPFGRAVNESMEKRRREQQALAEERAAAQRDSGFVNLAPFSGQFGEPIEDEDGDSEEINR